MSQYALDPDYGQSISKTINMFTFSRLFSENDSFKINNVHVCNNIISDCVVDKNGCIPDCVVDKNGCIHCLLIAVFLY